jgi:hypothetical protein
MPKQSKIQKIQTAKKRNTEKKKENYYNRPKFGTKQKLYFENTGTEGSVFYCIFSNTTGKSLYWHAKRTLLAKQKLEKLNNKRKGV